MYRHVKTGCKHIPPSEQPLQFQSGYYLNKPRIVLPGVWSGLYEKWPFSPQCTRHANYTTTHKESKVVAFWECWHPLSPESFISFKNLRMLSKNSNCSDVCSFMSYFVYVWSKGSQIVGRTQIVWMFENRVQKRIFQPRSCRSREKIYNEKLNNSCYL